PPAAAVCCHVRRILGGGRCGQVWPHRTRDPSPYTECIMRRPPSAFRPRVEHLEDRTVPSTTALSVSANPATAGQKVTLTATVTIGGFDNLQPGSGADMRGRVTFLDGGFPLGTINVTPSATNVTLGKAQLTTSALGPGSHSLTARY